MQIVRCISCEGYGWFESGLDGDTEDCDWCGGVGYVYRDEAGVDQQIPRSDYGKVADQLEALDQERMRDMGYQGTAKKPWQQDIRKGTKGGEYPGETPPEND